MQEEELPFPGTYWIEPGRLLAGPYPGSAQKEITLRNCKRLLQCGIRHIINLTEEYETAYLAGYLTPYEEHISRIAYAMGVPLSISRTPIEDMHAPSIRVMRSILDEIDQALAINQPVYVHCVGGRGRTGTVVGCYLVRHGFSGSDALKRINELRRHGPTADLPSPEAGAQREMVLNWKVRDHL